METNARGNILVRSHHPYRERYHYDFGPCKGWVQYGTTLDAANFGVWVNLEAREILTFVAGEEILVRCPTVESYHQELADMDVLYGPAPPAYAFVDTEGEWVYHFSERPR